MDSHIFLLFAPNKSPLLIGTPASSALVTVACAECMLEPQDGGDGKPGRGTRAMGWLKMTSDYYKIF